MLFWIAMAAVGLGLWLWARNERDTLREDAVDAATWLPFNVTTALTSLVPTSIAGAFFFTFGAAGALATAAGMHELLALLIAAGAGVLATPIEWARRRRS